MRAVNKGRMVIGHQRKTRKEIPDCPPSQAEAAADADMASLPNTMTATEMMRGTRALRFYRAFSSSLRMLL